MREPGAGSESKLPVLPPRADPAVLHCQLAGAGGKDAPLPKGFERLKERVSQEGAAVSKDPRNGAELLPTGYLKHAPYVIPPAHQPGGLIYHTGGLATADLVAPPPTPEQSPPTQGDAIWPPSLGSFKAVPQKDRVRDVYVRAPFPSPRAYEPSAQVNRAGAPSRANSAAVTPRYAPSPSAQGHFPVSPKAVSVTELKNRRPMTLRDFVQSSGSDVEKLARAGALPVGPRPARNIRGSRAVASGDSIAATQRFEASSSAEGKTTVASGCGGVREDPVQSSGPPAEPEDIGDWVMLDAGACGDEGKKVVEVQHVPFFLFDADAQASPLLLEGAQDGDSKKAAGSSSWNPGWKWPWRAA